MPEMTWTNPIIAANLADPFIFRADGLYWLIATGDAADGRHLPIYSSPDLRQWTFVRGAVAQGAAGAWNRFNFWAPEILQHDGRYWLYYTAKPTDEMPNAGNRVGLAVSDYPQGPYADCGSLFDHATLDGSPFRAADGQLWLYYVTDFGSQRGHPPGQIWVDRLLEPGRIADQGTRLISAHGWQEGPVLWPLLGPQPGPQKSGRYRLTYSLGAWADDTYRVTQAVADQPDGPFIESDQILMRSTPAVKGPGHHNFFVGPDGATWVVYHGWDPAMTARMPRIDRMQVDADGTLRSPAPTATQQCHQW